MSKLEQEARPMGFRIGEVSRRWHLHPNTIRRLEAKGIIRAQRDWAGARRFSEEEIERVEKILFTNEERSQ